jgi:ABC-type polysaccharide/polyol phosphate export permease
VSVYVDLYRYRELFANLFRRDLQVRYKGSLLGVAWSLVNPLILMGIYVLVFSVLWKAAKTPHYALYVLTGLLVWVFVSSALPMASRSLVAGAPLVKKVRFPRQLVPLSSVATQIVAYVAMLVGATIAVLIVIPDTRKTFLLAIPLSVVLIAFVAGLSLVLACGNVVFRDVEHLVAAGLLPWFFLTPVLYSFDQLPGGFQRKWVIDLLHWGNPLTPPLQALRAVLFYGTMPNAWDVVYTCVAAVVALAVGAWVFSRVDDRIAVEL